MERIDVSLYKDNKWDKEIEALGKEVWKDFPTPKRLSQFMNSQESCRHMTNIVTVDGDFAGFGIMLHLHTRPGEYSDYKVNYVCMTAIKPQFRGKGLGERLLQKLESYCTSPVIVSSNPFVNDSSCFKRMSDFYKEKGYERQIVGWTDHKLNQYEMFVKGDLCIDAWTGISERVQDLWRDYYSLSDDSERLEKEIAEGWTDEYGFVYSKDRKTLLKAASVERYFIPEGVEKIERWAFVGCKFDELHVPYTCKIDELPAEEYPVFDLDENGDEVGCVNDWHKPYSQEDEIEVSLLMVDEDAKYTDEYGVTYSKNGKRLLWSSLDFKEKEYYVPDGVLTICTYAFCHVEEELTLSVPRSIKVIGCEIFGSMGGRIIIREQ